MPASIGSGFFSLPLFTITVKRGLVIPGLSFLACIIKRKGRQVILRVMFENYSQIFNRSA